MKGKERKIVIKTPSEKEFVLLSDKIGRYDIEKTPTITVYSYDDIPHISYHDHSGAIELTLVTQGFGYHYINDVVKEISKGDVFLIDPGSWHSLFPIDKENSTHLQVINCVFVRSDFSRLEASFPEIGAAYEYFTNIDNSHPLRICNNHLERKHSAFCRPLLHHMGEIAKENSSLGRQSIILSVANMLFEIYRGMSISQTTAPQSESNPLVQKAIDMIEQEFLNPDFTVSHIYEALYVSKSHLCALFREHLGVPPIQILNARRIKYACNRMREDGICSNNLYLESGYSLYNTFYFNFKKITGFSLREYVKALNICLPTVNTKH